MAGAVLLIKNKAGNCLQQTANGYRWIRNKSDAPHPTSDESGTFSISGLRTGGYRLKEIEASSSYILSKTGIPFIISTFLSEDKEADSMLKAANREKNSRPFLPKTNEAKNTFLGVAGMVFVSFAIWSFIKKRIGVKK